MRIGWSQKVAKEKLYIKVQPKRNIYNTPGSDTEKLQLFGDLQNEPMRDRRKVKLLLFVIMDGNNKVGRP